MLCQQQRLCHKRMLYSFFIQAMKLDLEYKDEKISGLNRELEELRSRSGATDEEVSALQRQKNDFQMRLKDQASDSLLLF